VVQILQKKVHPKNGVTVSSGINSMSTCVISDFLRPNEMKLFGKKKIGNVLYLFWKNRLCNFWTVLYWIFVSDVFGFPILYFFRNYGLTIIKFVYLCCVQDRGQVLTFFIYRLLTFFLCRKFFRTYPPR